MNSYNKIRLEMRPDQTAGYVFIDFEDSNQHNGTVIEIGLKEEFALSGWTYMHVLQDTKGVLITGVEDGVYTLTLKQDKSDLLDIKYNLEFGDEESVEMTGITKEATTIEIEIGDKTKSKQFGGSFGGALLTSGSFTMMAASGGF